LKVIFAGTPANAARTLEALIAGPHEVVVVLTRPDAEVGRKRVLTPSPVAQISEAAGIKTFKATKVDESLSAELAATGAALGVVVAYGALFKSHVLNALQLGWVNLHYSLLPDWRGAAPVQNSVLAGDVDTGVTLFQLDEGMDTGPIFGTVATTIQVGETSGRLLERLTELGITLLNQELPLIEAGIAKAIPQDSGAIARLASKPTREGARIDWNETASAIERKVLGMNPEPMAHTSLGGETFRILDAVNLGVAPDGLLDQAAMPGTLVFESKRVMAVCANNTLLQLKTVQPAGKNPMPALDWSRGAANKFSSFDVEVA
jgi:methionyl-tRNA formyltransferase